MKPRPPLKPLFWIRFAGVVYVLHAFQKKSKHGIATPQTDMELIRARLKVAKRHYSRWRARHGEEAK